MKSLEIFIPCYNAHNTIKITLNSIVSQTLNIKGKVKVILVDDCSTKDYNYLLDLYKDNLDLTIIRLENKLSIGKVRQYCLDNRKLKYFTFIDADDMYSSNTSLDDMYSYLINNPQISMVQGKMTFYSFLDNSSNDNEVAHNCWIHGTMYKSSELKSYFPDTSIGEDTFFLNLEKLHSIGNGTYKFMDKEIYLWTDLNHKGENAANQYSFVENMITWMQSIDSALKEYLVSNKITKKHLNYIMGILVKSFYYSKIIYTNYNSYYADTIEPLKEIKKQFNQLNIDIQEDYISSFPDVKFLLDYRKRRNPLEKRLFDIQSPFTFKDFLKD